MNIAGVTNRLIETTFRLSLNAAQTLAGGTFDLIELPAPGVGYAWQVTSGAVSYTFVSIANDGFYTTIRSNTASTTKTQFEDLGVIAGATTSSFITLAATAPTNANSNIVENDKMVVDITASISGNGTAIIYGTARLITL